MIDGPLRQASDGSLLLSLKVVPGAKRDAIAGLLGDRLKVRVAAAPEGGKANRAICALVARTVGVRTKEVTIERGATSPVKTVRIVGVDLAVATNAFCLG